VLRRHWCCLRRRSWRRAWHRYLPILEQGSISHPFTYHVTSLLLPLLYLHGMVCPQRKQLEDWLVENRTALSSLANRTAHSGTEICLLEQTLRFLSQQQVCDVTCGDDYLCRDLSRIAYHVLPPAVGGSHAGVGCARRSGESLCC